RWRRQRGERRRQERRHVRPGRRGPRQDGPEGRGRLSHARVSRGRCGRRPLPLWAARGGGLAGLGHARRLGGLARRHAAGDLLMGSFGKGLLKAAALALVGTVAWVYSPSFEDGVL